MPTTITANSSPTLDLTASVPVAGDAGVALQLQSAHQKHLDNAKAINDALNSGLTTTNANLATANANITTNANNLTTANTNIATANANIASLFAGTSTEDSGHFNDPEAHGVSALNERITALENAAFYKNLIPDSGRFLAATTGIFTAAAFAAGQFDSNPVAGQLTSAGAFIHSNGATAGGPAAAVAGTGTVAIPVGSTVTFTGYTPVFNDVGKVIAAGTYTGYITSISGATAQIYPANGTNVAAATSYTLRNSQHVWDLVEAMRTLQGARGLTQRNRTVGETWHIARMIVTAADPTISLYVANGIRGVGANGIFTHGAWLKCIGGPLYIGGGNLGGWYVNGSSTASQIAENESLVTLNPVDGWKHVMWNSTDDGKGYTTNPQISSPTIGAEILFALPFMLPGKLSAPFIHTASVAF